MTRPDASTRLTYDDYVMFPDDGIWYELIEGEKFMSASPVPRHQLISRRIAFALESFLQTNPMGEFFHAPIDVVLDEHNIVVPDFVVISRDRSHIIGEKYISDAPDLIIEILSPSTRARDLGKKRWLYGLHGVLEYWVVDPDENRVELFELDGATATLKRAAVFNEGIIQSSQVLPGFEVSIDEVFRGL